MPRVTNPIVDHPNLNTVFFGINHDESSGTVYDDNIISIRQFRGIKYGKIPARFTQAELNEEFNVVTECYDYGPKCPQITGSVRMEDGLIGLPDGLARHAEDVFDEFNCLNLIITTPDDCSERSHLPVMVYIHGGGGWSGANSDWWCDGGSIVKKSIEMGKPIVHVAINYRLGPLGYMGSEELRKELGNVNGGNYGLRDIHLALTWLSKHITPFGGSPNKVTIYGESAGSLAVESQIHSLLPPHFHRAIMQSQTMGQPIFSTPRSIETKSKLYIQTKEKLGINTVKELQEVEWEQLINVYRALNPLGELAMIDGEFFDEGWRSRFSFGKGEDGEEGKGTPPAILIGNTEREGAVIKFLSMNSPKQNPRPSIQTLTTSLSTIISPPQAEAILKAYDILPTPSPESASQSISEEKLKEFPENLLTIIEDLILYKGTEEFIALARDLAKRNHTELKINQYIFKQRNPFQNAGIFKGVAVHALDLLYLHGGEKIFLQGERGGDVDADADGRANIEIESENTKGELKIMDEIKRTWIRFAYGDGEGEGAKREEAKREEAKREEGGEGVGVDVGEEVGEKQEKVKIFGPNGNIGTISIKEFKKERAVQRWKVIDGLGAEVVEGILGVLLRVYAGVVGEG
ncbi:hypothetical protein NHQ30_002062 [Ciborinia camelliae]|nr:hypothetical protein NHQ30_002062 [Ciborinia camelliae]